MNAIKSFKGEYEWLSNFYMRPLVYRNLRWKSAEHAYQAMKTTDLATQERIRLEAPHARDAKSMGRHVVLRPQWGIRRLMFMSAIVTHKFALGSEVTRWLIATGDAHLEEDNAHGDTFWGTVNGKGENHFGLTLMSRRTVLQEL